MSASVPMPADNHDPLLPSSPPASHPATNLQVAKAGFWSVTDLALRNLIQFTIGIVLARLLMPAEFGLAALASFFVTICTVFTQNAIATALVQHQETSKGQEQALFWINAMLAAALAVAVALLGSPAARYFQQPVLSELMLLAAATIMLASFGSVPLALLTRKLNYRAIFICGISAAVISGAVGLLMALNGYGAWSLAVMLLANATVQSTLCWFFTAWRPSFPGKDADYGWDVFRSAAWIGGAGLLDTLYNQAFAPLLGRLYGTQSIGFFQRGLSLQMLLTNFLSATVGRVALPVFATMKNDDELLRSRMKSSLRLMMLLIAPAMAGLVLTAPDIIQTLYGEKWLGAAPILRITAIAGLLYPISLINLQVVLAKRLSRHFLGIEIIKKLIGVSILVVASQFGLETLACGMVVSSIIALYVNSRAVAHTLGYGLRTQLRDLLPLLAPALAMVLTVAAIVEFAQFASAIRLVLCMTAGATIYIVFGFGFRIEAFLDARDAILMVLSRNAGKDLDQKGAMP